MAPLLQDFSSFDAKTRLTKVIDYLQLMVEFPFLTLHPYNPGGTRSFISQTV